jgi:hypothetical protein
MPPARKSSQRRPAPRTKVWVGHYIHDPHRWFLVAARTKNRAIRLANSGDGEPNVDSMRPLRGAAIVQFSARLQPVPDAVDGSTELEVYFKDTDLVALPTDEPRIERIVRHPPSPPPRVETSLEGALQGIQDPKVLKAYLPHCQECRQNHIGACSPVAR